MQTTTEGDGVCLQKNDDAEERFDITDPSNPHRLSAVPKRSLPRKFFRETAILCDALHWRVVQGISGPFSTILRHPAHPSSEWGAAHCWAKEKRLKLLVENGVVCFGSVVFLPLAIPMVFCTSNRAKVFVEGERYADVAANYMPSRMPEAAGGGTFEGEIWVSVNGVSTTREMHRMNARQLADVFHRQIYCFHNPTQGTVLDLLECTLGRTLNKLTKVARKEADFLRTLFRTYPRHKVVLIAHSQGTIITGNAIEYLIKEDKCAGLERLEVYTFGCAATEMFTVRDLTTGALVPFYEHYANKKDYVARIGVLKDTEKFPGFLLPGKVFVRHSEGHLLGEHYLPGLVAGLYLCQTDQSQQSQLASYIPTASSC